MKFRADKVSLYGRSRKKPFNVVVQWRRPSDFFETDYTSGQMEKSIFLDNTIEPTAVRIGVLGDEWFLSALAMLAERPALIERLFITKKVND